MEEMACDWRFLFNFYVSLIWANVLLFALARLSVHVYSAPFHFLLPVQWHHLWVFVMGMRVYEREPQFREQ